MPLVILVLTLPYPSSIPANLNRPGTVSKLVVHNLLYTHNLAVGKGHFCHDKNYHVHSLQSMFDRPDKNSKSRQPFMDKAAGNTTSFIGDY